jgi:cell division septation protein DedD
MNQRPGKKDSEYTELISKANTSFNLKEYREAKKSYEASLNIKPEASLPIKRIGMIDSILTFREEARIKEAPEEEISKPAEVKTTEIAQVGESEKTKSVMETTPPDKTGEPNAKAASIGDGRYHVVVGCFEIRNNAINFSKVLRGKGHDSRIIPILDGRMSAVTYQSFGTEREAFKVLRQVHRDFDKDAWVLKH